MNDWEIDGAMYVEPVGEIDYLTENPTPQYIRELDEAVRNGLEALNLFALKWRTMAFDGYESVRAMSQEDFEVFAEGLAIERQKGFSGKGWVKKYGNIAAPLPLLATTIAENHFMVPWGTAWIQSVRGGILKLVLGVWQVDLKQQSRSVA